jgi:hypothetical protein
VLREIPRDRCEHIQGAGGIWQEPSGMDAIGVRYGACSQMRHHTTIAVEGRVKDGQSIRARRAKDDYT